MTGATRQFSENRKGIWITVLLLTLVALAFFIGAFLRYA
jgi:hypothetical protein